MQEENLENAPAEELVVDAPTEELTPTPIEGEGEPAPEPEAWEPNYNFTVKDEERQFDDWAKPLVKDKETEDYFREVMQKYYGIDEIKARRDEVTQTLEEERKTWTEDRKRYDNIDQSLQMLSSYVENDNLDAFFKAVKIPEDKIFSYVTKRLQYQDMSPEDRQMHDRRIQIEQENHHLKQQNLQSQENYNQMMYNQRMNDLDMVLTRPEVSQVVQNFDARTGNAGSFKQEVVNRGIYHMQVNGKDLSAEQVVNEVLGLVGGLNVPGQEQPQGQAGQPTPPNTPQGGQQAAQKKPVIPKIDASGASPTRPIIKSIDDIKRRAAELSR